MNPDFEKTLAVRTGRVDLEELELSYNPQLGTTPVGNSCVAFAHGFGVGGGGNLFIFDSRLQICPLYIFGNAKRRKKEGMDLNILVKPGFGGLIQGQIYNPDICSCLLMMIIVFLKWHISKVASNMLCDA